MGLVGELRPLALHRAAAVPGLDAQIGSLGVGLGPEGQQGEALQVVPRCSRETVVDLRPSKMRVSAVSKYSYLRGRVSLFFKKGTARARSSSPPAGTREAQFSRSAKHSI